MATTRVRIRLLLVALLGAAMLGACGTGERALRAAEENPQWRQRREQAAQVVALLEQAGLVFEIGQEVTVEGRTVTLERLAVDREVVYLEFSNDESPGLSFRLLEGEPVGGGGTGGPGLNVFPVRLDPDSQAVTIRVWPAVQSPKTHRDVQVPVDLRPLAGLAAPRPLTAEASGNGVRVAAYRFTRGVAVSTVELSATIVDPEALVLTEQRQDNDYLFAIRAESAGAAVPVLDAVSLRIEGGVWHAVIPLLGVPEQGELRLTVESIYFKGMPDGVETKGDARTVNGPWEITIDLDG